MAAWGTCARARSNAWPATRASSRSAAAPPRSCWTRWPSGFERGGRSGEEGAELLDHRLRSLLGQVVAAVDGAARHRAGAIVSPDRGRVVPLADLALGAPQHQQWALHLGAGDAAGAV